MAASPGALPVLPAELEPVRAALERFQDPVTAVREGYFSTLGCISFPEGGTHGGVEYMPGDMGVHFLNPALIGPTLVWLSLTMTLISGFHYIYLATLAADRNPGA